MSPPVREALIFSDAELRTLVADRNGGVPMARARRLRDEGHGRLVSYSRKVFIPLTRLCRDVCGYCTFARSPREGEACYLTPDEVLAIARAGVAAGCREALFTLGDKPELRYRAARDELDRLGFPTTLAYLAEMCGRVLRETGLLPHANAGVMDGADIAALRKVTVSQGLMLESSSERLCERGGPHWGSPDKAPSARLATLREAGEQAVPFTSGILIGIGETRAERLEALLALRDLHRRYGHLQEVIVQNFRAKSDSRMAGSPEPSFDDLAWTVALARLVFGPQMNIQAPPNLSGPGFGELIGAGLNDWGGVSPVTPDHVNPEAPWPQIDLLRRETEARGKVLVQRLALYPAYCSELNLWQDVALHRPLLQVMDADGFARSDDWSPGIRSRPPAASAVLPSSARDRNLGRILDHATAGEALEEGDIVTLFAARGPDVETIRQAADALRRKSVGDTVRYVVNRNINYTNICYYRCGFCAFSKGKTSENLRGAPYDLAHEEIARRVQEAWDRGATEVCMQGGIHPLYTGQTYIDLCRLVKRTAPDMHIHAFSPLEVSQGARTLGLEVGDFLRELKMAGLGTLPGTAAEVLEDDIRAVLCPDKIGTEEWFEVITAAHAQGLRTTSTIMFGHIETPRHWARHLLRLRALQRRTGGVTEFVPLPFVHMEAPIYHKGRARPGPSWRETLLIHAVARLALHPVIPNIQVSWVKLGLEGAAAALQAGANDLGGTLMNESISRAAGAAFGQETSPDDMDRLIRSIGRVSEQRTTLYSPPPEAQRRRSYVATPLVPLIETLAVKRRSCASA